MANILSYGAGAAKGLESLLARLLAEEEFGEVKRRNQATEGLQQRQLDETSKLRMLQQQSLDESRRALMADRETDNARAVRAQMPHGTDLTPETRENWIRLGVITPEQAPEEPRYSPDFVGPHDPSLSPTRFRLAPTPAELRTEELNAQAEVRAQQAAEREERLASYGPPVVVIGDPNSYSGSSVVPRNRVPAGGTPAPPSATLQTDVVRQDVSADQLDRIIEMFEGDPANGRPGAQSWVGPLSGRFEQGAQAIVPESMRSIDPERADFIAASTAFQNAVIKAITGAQMSEPEAQRIKSQIPLPSDNPTVWRQKAQQTRQNLADLSARMSGATALNPNPEESFDLEYIPGQGFVPRGGNAPR